MAITLSQIDVNGGGRRVFQRNRAYSLIIGDALNGNGFEINSLNISFDVSKSSSNKDKTNSCTIEIYNLSKEKQQFLEREYIAADFKAGFIDTTVKQLFSGQVVHTSTRKSGTDLVTQIQMGSGYVELNHSNLSKVVPEGKTVKELAQEIIKGIPGISRSVFNGTNINNQVIDGYPLTGSGKQALDKLSKTYSLEWHLDNTVMYINDASGTSTDDLGTAFVLSPDTGMIDLPYSVSGDSLRTKKDKAKKDGVQVRAILNAEFTCGSIIKLEDCDQFDGYYKIESLRTWGEFRGNPYYSDLRLSKKIKV